MNDSVSGANLQPEAKQPRVLVEKNWDPITRQGYNWFGGS